MNDQYNNKLAEFVNARAREGRHIVLVPIGSTVATNELKDGLHPNDIGYQKMAVAWIEAVNQAQDKGWFKEPEPGDGKNSWPSSNTKLTVAGFVEPSANNAAQFLVRASVWQHAIMLISFSASILPWFSCAS